jgi:RHS repeat-associated protein
MTVGSSILQVVNGTVIYPHKNQVGTTMRETDASQNIANYYEYDAWGQPLVVAETVSQQYRFTQKELDPDFIAANSQSRRYHFPARFYVPFRGIFAQIDPKAMMSAGNKRALYLYVMANPLLFVDPDGRDMIGVGGYQLSSGSNISPGYGLGMDVVNPNAAPGTANVITVGIGQSLAGGVAPGGAPSPGGAGGYSTMMTPSGLLQTWVCASGAVYNYVNMGGGQIQNPCAGDGLGEAGAGNSFGIGSGASNYGILPISIAAICYGQGKGFNWDKTGNPNDSTKACPKPCDIKLLNKASAAAMLDAMRVAMKSCPKCEFYDVHVEAFDCNPALLGVGNKQLWACYYWATAEATGQCNPFS